MRARRALIVPERYIQRQILEYLSKLPNCFAFEIYNSGIYSRKLKTFKANSQFRPRGIPDIYVCYHGVSGFIEVKSRTGILSPFQKALHEKMRGEHCLPVGVCRSIEDVVVFLAEIYLKKNPK